MAAAFKLILSLFYCGYSVFFSGLPQSICQSSPQKWPCTHNYNGYQMLTWLTNVSHHSPFKFALIAIRAAVNSFLVLYLALAGNLCIQVRVRNVFGVRTEIVLRSAMLGVARICPFCNDTFERKLHFTFYWKLTAILPAQRIRQRNLLSSKDNISFSNAALIKIL